MKSLIFSDLHLSSYSKWGYNDKEKLSRRLVEQRDVLNQILKLCQEEKIERVIFGGDFFHNDKEISTEVLNVAKEFFDTLNQLQIPFYAVRGNHDISLQKECNPRLHYSLNPFLSSSDPFYQIPSIYFGHFDVEHNIDKIKNYDLVIIHNTPIGSKLGGHIFEEGINWKILSENNKLVLFGHIHKKQQLSDNTLVMGCPMALDFGDDEDRGCYILDGTDLKFIKLNYPQFITLDAKNDDGKRSSEHYFRITGADHNSISENEVTVKKPTFFDNKLKSVTLVDTLKEWLKLQDKPQDYIKSIEGLLQDIGDGRKRIADLTLDSINLENFLSFERATLSINKGLNLIEGIGGDFSSNGSGKSSLMEAIFWCLFGETTKGLTGDDVIRKYPDQQKDCEVLLQLSKDGKPYIAVSRRRKVGLKILDSSDKEGYTTLNEGMKQKESQEYLEQLIGFSKQTFLASIYFSQDSLLLLTKIGVSEKNSIISNLLGFDQYDILQSKVIASMELFKTSKSLVEKEKERINIQLDYQARDIKQFEKRLTEIEEKLSSIKELGLKLKADIEIKEAQIEALKENGSGELDSNLASWNEHEDRLELLIQENGHKLENFKVSDDSKEIEELSKLIRDIKAEQRYLEKLSDQKDVELMKFENLKDGQTCTYCGSEISVDHKEKYISNIRSEIIGIEQSIKKLTYSDLEEKHKVLLDNKEKSDNEYKVLLKNSSNLKSELVKVGKEKQTLIESANVIGNEIIVVRGMKEKLEIYRKNSQEQKLEYMSTELQIEESNKVTQKLLIQLGDVTNKITDIETNNKILEFWKEAFSFKGIKSLLVSSFCNSFNNILSLYMIEISNGVISCEFSPTSVIKSGEERNKLDLLVYLRGTLQSYESLSGGEKKRVDCGVAISFARWLKKQYGLSNTLLGILIFDELFDALDSHARECLLPLLKAEGETQAVYIISHTNDLSAYADKVIKVRKTNRISSLVGVV